MARIRSIKPEFWTSEQVMDCSPIARLLFIGLWTFCDDGGRTAYSVKRLKAQIFPADDISSESVRRMIDELSANALIDLYHIEGKQYLQITGWRHQKIEKPNYQFPDKNGHIPEGWNVLNRRTFADHLTPESSRVESIGVERKGGESNKRSRAGARGGSVADTPSNSTDDWPSNYREQFAEVYPSNVSMAAALEILDDTRKSRKVSWHGLLVALANYAENKPADRHWMNPKTWLEQERWNDKPAHIGKHERRHVADELAEEARRLEGEGNGPDVAVGGPELGGDHAQVVPGRKPA